MNMQYLTKLIGEMHRKISEKEYQNKGWKLTLKIVTSRQRAKEFE